MKTLKNWGEPSNERQDQGSDDSRKYENRRTKKGRPNALKRLPQRLWAWLVSPKNRGFAAIILIIILLLMAATILLLTQKEEAVIVPPKSSPKRSLGIDMSTWQHPEDIDYDKLVTRLSFAILRLGYTERESGTTLQIDDAFEEHYRNLSAKSLPIGVYWYSCANTPAKAKKEAEEAIKLLNKKPLQLPIFWDTEDETHQIHLSQAELTETALAFLETIEAAGYEAGIYSHSYWLRDNLDLERLQNYEIWVAAWDGEDPTHIPYRIWQFSETGERPGYAGPLDLNYRY